MYTYKNFAMDVIALANGEEISVDKATLIAKAEDLIAIQNKKADYNSTHKKPAVSKMSDETKALIADLSKVLTATPQTAAELNAVMGTNYTALRISNAVKRIEGAQSCKVVRPFVNNKGLKAEKEYTAYFIG